MAKALVTVGVVECKCERCSKVARFAFGASKTPIPTSDWHGMTLTASNSESSIYQEKQKQLVTR